MPELDADLRWLAQECAEHNRILAKIIANTCSKGQ
jgi:hypothetical protein